MKTLRVLILILFIFIGNGFYGQIIGGRLKEKKNQVRLFKHIKRQSGGGWHYRNTPSGEGTLNTSKLFKRQRPHDRNKRDKIQYGINRRRNLKRERGNNVFHKKKYKKF